MNTQKKAPAATEANSTNNEHLNITLCSGFGQFHTDHPEKRERKPYKGVSIGEIDAMAAIPTSIDKAKGQWIIPTSYINPLSRDADHLREHGQFHAAALDLD